MQEPSETLMTIKHTNKKGEKRKRRIYLPLDEDDEPSATGFTFRSPTDRERRLLRLFFPNLPHFSHSDLCWHQSRGRTELLERMDLKELRLPDSGRDIHARASIFATDREMSKELCSMSFGSEKPCLYNNKRCNDLPPHWITLLVRQSHQTMPSLRLDFFHGSCLSQLMCRNTPKLQGSL